MLQKALVIIDLEKEWADKNSDYYLGDLKDYVEKINKLITQCRDQNYKIIFIKHVEKNPEDGFQENTENVEFLDNLNIDKKDTIITKNKISAFYQTDIEEKLKRIKEVVVCGALVNMCVRSFIEGAYDRDMDIKVIKDWCLGFEKEDLEFTFKDLKKTRGEIVFLNLDELIR